jgi:predicted enzyme related to lactoylglutathione lyase
MSTELLVNIDIPDLELAIAFYAEGLGLKVGRRLFDGAAEMLGGSSRINLLEKPAGSAPFRHARQRRAYQRHWTPVHLDFVVPEIRAAVERAGAAGASLEGKVQTFKWGRMATMADPFGNGFCLIQFLGRGYDEPPRPASKRPSRMPQRTRKKAGKPARRGQKRA